MPSSTYDWLFRKKNPVYPDKILKDNWRNINEHIYKYLRVISGNWPHAIFYWEVEEPIRTSV